MREITENSSFLQNEEFLKDKYKFSLIGHNLGIEETKIYSDEESYIFVVGKQHKPIWLWTIENITSPKILEIKNVIDLFINMGYTSFACKESFYNYTNELSACFECAEISGCYFCENLIKPRECDGSLEKANAKDKSIITKLWYDDCVEADADNHISYELAKKFVDRFLASNTFFVWRNNEGKIVSIIDYEVIDTWAEVAHAYTVPEERGKGYMANAVYELTKIILDQNLVPVLSTDYNYLASNRCYSNIGYCLEEKLVVFTKNRTKEKRDKAR